MKVLLYVCFILFVTDGATGQTPDPVCEQIGNFKDCKSSNGCNEEISRCTCFEEQPFCRCNSKKGEFYLDENCSQRWTVTTFALVASLPGLTLAVLVGVIVYVLTSKKSHTGEEMNTHNTASREQDMFPGITFASDMNGRPPANLRPVQQDHTPMTAMSSRPFSPSSGVYQSAVRTDGRPRETNSMYSGMRDPPMGAPVQPYSTGAGRGQIVSNPYARDSSSQNPYEGDHQDYRPQAPSHTYEDLQKQNRPYAPAPAPLYSSEHGNLRNGFPRPQLNLQY